MGLCAPYRLSMWHSVTTYSQAGTGIGKALMRVSPWATRGKNVKVLQQLIPTNINDLGASEITSPLKQQRVANFCCLIFVIVAAYRSVFPRIDVPRICWFQTPLNYILYGRIVATVAEICWATQISIVLSNFASGLVSRTTYLFAIGIVPIAFIAECFSWTCLCTENQLYCTCGKFH